MAVATTHYGARLFLEMCATLGATLRRTTPNGNSVAAILLDLHSASTPERMLERLQIDGKNAWSERLWIADLGPAIKP